MSHFRRWGLLWAVIATAILMIGSALRTHLGVLRHTDELAVIHGEYMMSSGTFTSDDLAKVVDDNHHIGVWSISRFDSDGRLTDSAGRPASDTVRAPDGPVRVEQGRFRIEQPLQNGAIVVEYVPLLAFDLGRRTAIGLALSVLAALLLVSVSTLWIRYRLRLEESARQTAETQQLAQLGTLSAVVAHELRNPLTVLLGHVQLVREDFPSNPSIQHIERGALRLNSLLESLLSFARSGEVCRETLSLRSFIEAAGEEAGIAELVIEGDVPEWRLDRHRMGQVLVNLLRNAATASPDSPVLVGMRIEGGDLLLEVWDEGPGIPADSLQTIFEPFFTTRTQGTGLGLAIARDIVAKHGGTLTAHNPTGGGAQFTARIPA